MKRILSVSVIEGSDWPEIVPRIRFIIYGLGLGVANVRIVLRQSIHICVAHIYEFDVRVVFRGLGARIIFTNILITKYVTILNEE